MENLQFWTDALTIHAADAPVALVGTRAGELNRQDIQMVDKLLTDFFADK